MQACECKRIRLISRPSKSYFMKLFKTVVLSQFLLLTISLIPFTSCNKSNDTPSAQHTIQGLWIGNAANASSSPFYALSIKPDGKITFETIASGQEQFGAGTWTLVGSDFSANVTTLYGFQANIGTQQTLTAKFDSKSGVLSEGKYRNTSPANDSGTFSVTKVE